MTPLILALIIAALFAGLLAYEAGSNNARLQLHPAGLLAWLMTGNWPAKVGAGLMIIGIGALLRYAFANIDVPPETKLGAGVVAAAALGFGSMILRNRPMRRAIHLALAGAAFGVAYLTAYSAYGFFNYITDVNALALLALVAVAAGVFAVQSNVMSVAILAMGGGLYRTKIRTRYSGCASRLRLLPCGQRTQPDHGHASRLAPTHPPEFLVYSGGRTVFRLE